MYAQTNIQLYNQLQNQGYSIDDLVLIKNAYEIATHVFSGRYQASGKDFIAHGVGTASILCSLNVSAEVIAAGIIHNVYGNGDFGFGKKGPSKAKRQYIIRHVGIEVESYCVRFFRLIRRGKNIFHSIREDIEGIEPYELNTVLILLADLLEHHLDLGVLYYNNVEKHLQFIDKNRHVMVEIAQKMGFPSLASDLKKVFDDTFMSEISIEFQNKNGPNHSFVIPPKAYRKSLYILLCQELDSRVNYIRKKYKPWLRHLKHELAKEIRLFKSIIG